MKKKFPFIRQQNINDCGATCLAMVCQFYGKRISLENLRNYSNTTRSGVTTYDIKEALDKLCFENYIVKLSNKEIKKIPLPAILYWNQKHFVVLYKISQRNNSIQYHIADPNFGKVKLNTEEFNNGFFTDGLYGVGILLEPTSAFNKITESNNNYSIAQQIIGFRRLIGNFKNKLFFSFILTLFAMGANWAIPVLFQFIVDKGIKNNNINLIYLISIGQLALFMGYLVSMYSSNILLTKNSFKIGITFLGEYLNKLIKLPAHFFDTKANSDLIQLVDDQENLKSFLSYDFIEAVLALCNILVFSILIIHYNVSVFILFCLFAFLASLWSLLFLNKRRLINYRRFSLFSEGKSHIYELVMGMKEIKINSAQEKRVKHVCEIQDRINSFQLKELYLNGYSSLGVSSLNKIRDIFITIFCAYLVIEGQITIGILLTISYLIAQISSSLDKILRFAINIQDAKLSFDRLTEIQSQNDEGKGRNLCIDLCNIKCITLQNVCFKYLGNFSPFVLQNISCGLEIGKITAIVGSSGSGKTTLLKLLLAFYNPTKGNITIGSHSMSEINPDEWRKGCGVVMQDGFLFSGSISENIAFSDENPKPENIRKAAQIACIHDYIESLPLKYETHIGNTGVDLSGGQKQRLLIARAIYKNPKFLFLDEATSFLDATNELLIMNNLTDYFKGRTVLIIAHRLSTVKNADNIIVLEHGKIVEEGNHNHLIERKGRYYDLVKNQLELE